MLISRPRRTAAAPSRSWIRTRRQRVRPPQVGHRRRPRAREVARVGWMGWRGCGGHLSVPL
eukprot:1134862-Prymnesium_polylepis.1